MSGRIVEQGLDRFLESTGVCCWLDLERSYEKSLCDIGCLGNNPECKYYSSLMVRQPRNVRGNGHNPDSIPDYLL